MPCIRRFLTSVFNLRVAAVPRSSLRKMADGSENHGTERNFHGSNNKDENSACEATALEVDEKSESLSIPASNTLIPQIGLIFLLELDIEK